MVDPKKLDDIAKKLSDAVPERLKTAKDEMSKQFKQVLQTQLGKLDLVSRDEFDTQTQVLLRTRQKLEELEKKLSELENR
ncbi:ubiquinone biosynthesis accessory factor UbiK [Kangiella geojedonensis]|uniref:ubiquinone biosynthesis accessory factor UbiK n=1 Tax=Kangiella geojedonensis TaxID=914150 RepID=UPI0006271A8C|nr:accessory factor UbiK family protein [Kangiella geojedonensis]